MAGSISPERVPIKRPAKGVKPMVVSMHLPPFTAEMLEPFPKWQVTTFVSAAGLPKSSMAREAT